MSLDYGYEKNDSGVTLTELYDKPQGVVEIPKEWKGRKVTAIGEALFRGQNGLREIVIPEGVTVLGWWALRECTHLTNVTLPQSLIDIGYRAFSGCTALTAIVLPPSIEKIGEAAFWGCTALKRISLPPKIDRIRNRTFYGCAHLTDIVIPPGVENIEWGAFEYCRGLRRLTIPDGVKEIGSNALRECSGLKELNLPDGMAAISENLFGRRNLPRLEQGYIPHVKLELWEEEAKKILSLCYLTTVARHDDHERQLYEIYIRYQAKDIITMAITLADIPALQGLYAMGLPGKDSLDDYIDLANELRCRDAVVSLLDYKRRLTENPSVRQHLAAEFTLSALDE